MLNRGDEVVVLDGPMKGKRGQVNYARIRGSEVEAYSVILFDLIARPAPYSGTIFGPSAIQKAEVTP